MVYNGRVKNGVIVLDDGVRLPEGAKVRFWLANDENVKAVEDKPADDRPGKRETS